jgi:hypothetical protein
MKRRAWSLRGHPRHEPSVPPLGSPEGRQCHRTANQGHGLSGGNRECPLVGCSVVVVGGVSLSPGTGPEALWGYPRGPQVTPRGCSWMMCVVAPRTFLRRPCEAICGHGCSQVPPYPRGPWGQLQGLSTTSCTASLIDGRGVGPWWSLGGRWGQLRMPVSCASGTRRGHQRCPLSSPLGLR